MTTTTMRKMVLNYLADAEEDKVKAIFTLLKDDIGGGRGVDLTDEQYKILEIEQQLYLSGKVKPFSKEETIKLIRR